MKRFCSLAAVLLLGGCASCYRTVNELACFMDTWARVFSPTFHVRMKNPRITWGFA